MVACRRLLEQTGINQLLGKPLYDPTTIIQTHLTRTSYSIINIILLNTSSYQFGEGWFKESPTISAQEIVNLFPQTAPVAAAPPPPSPPLIPSSPAHRLRLISLKIMNGRAPFARLSTMMAPHLFARVVQVEGITKKGPAGPVNFVHI